MTTPKVGDRVVAMLGKSRNEGTVTNIGPRLLWLHVDGAASQFTDFLREDWHFEILPPLVPPIPDVEGTAVMDCDGDVWTRYPEGWAMSRNGATDTLKRLTYRFGPLTAVAKND